MDIMQTGTVLAIVVITYLIGAAAKLIPHIKDEYIPLLWAWLAVCWVRLVCLLGPCRILVSGSCGCSRRCHSDCGKCAGRALCRCRSA